MDSHSSQLSQRKLAVIPQDPFLFGGTVRANLDPWNKSGDSEIWNVLREVRRDSIVSAAGGLDARITEQSSSLSVGQQQILCLAR